MITGKIVFFLSILLENRANVNNSVDKYRSQNRFLIKQILLLKEKKIDYIDKIENALKDITKFIISDKLMLKLKDKLAIDPENTEKIKLSLEFFLLEFENTFLTKKFINLKSHKKEMRSKQLYSIKEYDFFKIIDEMYNLAAKESTIRKNIINEVIHDFSDFFNYKILYIINNSKTSKVVFALIMEKLISLKDNLLNFTKKYRKLHKRFLNSAKNTNSQSYGTITVTKTQNNEILKDLVDRITQGRIESFKLENFYIENIVNIYNEILESMNEIFVKMILKDGLYPIFAIKKTMIKELKKINNII